MGTTSVPIRFDDPVNSKILAVSEDMLQGFQRDPLGEISRQTGLELSVVVERIRAMLQAGTIRRVRQTLLSINLAPGALTAWQVPDEKLDAAFDYMCQRDPFSGHIVIRTTDAPAPGSSYKLWTTVKIPLPYSLEKHCDYLAAQTGAERYRLMPAKSMFALGVGHVRRQGLEPGSKSDVPAEPTALEVVTLNDEEWRVLTALKREFAPEELAPDLWRPRAEEAAMSLDEFYEVAESLNRRNVMGRFSTFLEHVKPVADYEAVTGSNGLFHWAVPPGREMEAGGEIGRHHILTHVYWRDAGPEFANVNVMAVGHGPDRKIVQDHKAAIDAHLQAVGIPVSYTNVFWSTRSEIKPSEVSPAAYREWCLATGLDPDAMRE